MTPKLTYFCMRFELALAHANLKTQIGDVEIAAHYLGEAGEWSQRFETEIENAQKVGD